MENKRKEYFPRDKLNEVLEELPECENPYEMFDVSLSYLIDCIKFLQDDLFPKNQNKNLDSGFPSPRRGSLSDNSNPSNYNDDKQYTPLSLKEKQDIIDDITRESKKNLTNNLALIATVKKGLSNFSPIEQNEKQNYTRDLAADYLAAFQNYMYKDNVRVTIDDKRKEVFQIYPPNPTIKREEKKFGISKKYSSNRYNPKTPKSIMTPSKSSKSYEQEQEVVNPKRLRGEDSRNKAKKREIRVNKTSDNA